MDRQDEQDKEIRDKGGMVGSGLTDVFGSVEAMERWETIQTLAWGMNQDRFLTGAARW